MRRPLQDSYIKQLARNFPHLSRLIRRFPVPNINRSLNPFMTDSDPSLAGRIMWRTIPSGPAGTEATLRAMGELAHKAASDPAFVRVVQENAIGPSIDYIDLWIRQRFKYRNEREEVVRTPQAMIEEWLKTGNFEGDCDDVATLAAAILLVNHLPARFVAIRWDAGNPEFKHVFTESDGYILDATVAPGTQYAEIERMEYVV